MNVGQTESALARDFLIDTVDAHINQLINGQVLVGMLVSVLLAHSIPPMPLYSELYKTSNHEGDIVLKTSGSVMLMAFVILTFVGVTAVMWPALKASRMEPVEALRCE
jgi:putative ABC transport system permease protein